MNNEIIIIKSADVGVGTWLKEKFTPSGIVRMFGEGFISEYSQKMSELRDIDNQIENWRKDLKVYLDRMESAYNSKRVLDFVFVVTAINKALRNISSQTSKVNVISDESLQEFEKERVLSDPSTWSQIKNWFHDPSDQYDLSDEQIRAELIKFFKGNKGGNISAKAGEDFYFELIKNAGWLDDWKREWVYKKLQSKQRKERDAALKGFFNKTKNTLSRIDSLIKDLHDARAYGEIGAYLDGLRKISNLQMEFEKSFKFLYEKHLKSLIDISQPSPATDAPVPSSAPLTEKGDGKTSARPASSEVPSAVPTTGPSRSEAPVPETAEPKDQALINFYLEDLERLNKEILNEKQELESERSSLTEDEVKLRELSIGDLEKQIQSHNQKLSKLGYSPEGEGEGEGEVETETEDLTALVKSNDDFKKLSKEEQEQEINKLKGIKLQLQTLLSQVSDQDKSDINNQISFITDALQRWKEFTASTEGQPQPAGNTETTESAKPTNAGVHFNFIKKLASCKNQYDAAQLLLKYSEQIEDHDLNASMKLLALAEGILDA